MDEKQKVYTCPMSQYQSEARYVTTPHSRPCDANTQYLGASNRSAGVHPEVKSDKPGSCPKRGMDLVLEEESKEE